MIRFKKFSPYFYIAFLIIVFVYVREIVTSEELSVETKDKKEVVEEVKPVNVTLYVIGNQQRRTYEKTLKNTNTFDDLLEKLVKDKTLVYEKTEYTYGTKYDQINGENAPEGYVWKVYIDDEDSTHNTKGVKLVDGSTYTLSLEKL